MKRIMLTISLKMDLAEQISSLAGKSQANTEVFVDKALRTHLAQFCREKIRVETEALDQQFCQQFLFRTRSVVSQY